MKNENAFNHLLWQNYKKNNNNLLDKKKRT